MGRCWIACRAPRRAARVLFAGAALAAGVASADGTPRELGRVTWERDFDRATALARQSGRPLLALFQEVPGCATCVGFGESALSHPLVVEAIETAFVPVAVFNNRPGADARVLARFGEPAWNNPVVRFLDPGGRDWIPRRDRVYHTFQLAARMRDALHAAGRDVPPYLSWVLDEATLADAARATFATSCFWEGEACLGALPSVRATRAAWSGGHEVVEVWFDGESTSYRELLGRVRDLGCADRVVVGDGAEDADARAVFGSAVLEADAPPRPAGASDQKHHLRASPLRAYALTPLQQTRLNAALAAGRDPRPWLSPRQRLAWEL